MFHLYCWIKLLIRISIHFPHTDISHTIIGSLVYFILVHMYTYTISDKVYADKLLTVYQEISLMQMKWCQYHWCCMGKTKHEGVTRYLAPHLSCIRRGSLDWFKVLPLLTFTWILGLLDFISSDSVDLKIHSSLIISHETMVCTIHLCIFLWICDMTGLLHGTFVS